MFIYRGPLEPDDPHFCGCEIPLSQLLKLCQGNTVQAYAIVYGGRQTGKTTLLKKLVASLPSSVLACRVDFQERPAASFEEVTRYIAQRFAEEFGERISTQLDQPSNPALDLKTALRRIVQASNAARVVLCLEELGALRKEVQDQLANVLRAIFTNRNERASAPLNQLMVVIAGSIEMYDLAVMEVSTLHNVCEEIYLGDLSAADATRLIVEHLELPPTSALDHQQIAGRIFAQVEGHPYFTQRLGARIERAAPNTWHEVDDIIKETSANDDLLRYLHKGITDHKLGAACQTLLNQPPRFTRQDGEMVRLELLGLAKERNKQWTARNEFLAQAMRAWVTQLASNNGSPKKTIDRASLRSMFAKHFKLDELETLCFDLEIPFENLKGETFDAKARSLIEHLESREQFDALADWISQHRSDIVW